MSTKEIYFNIQGPAWPLYNRYSTTKDKFFEYLSLFYPFAPLPDPQTIYHQIFLRRSVLDYFLLEIAYSEICLTWGNYELIGFLLADWTLVRMRYELLYIIGRLERIILDIVLMLSFYVSIFEVWSIIFIEGLLIGKWKQG